VTWRDQLADALDSLGTLARSVVAFLRDHFGICAGVAVLLTVLWLMQRPDNGSTDTAKVAGWIEQTIAFYETGSSQLLKAARNRHASRIVLHVESNASQYYCSSPCNEGFAETLSRSLDAGAREEVIYWKQPVEVSWLSNAIAETLNVASRFLAPSWRNQLERGWFRLDRRGTRTGPLKTVDMQNALHARIQVDGVTLLGEANKFQARVSLCAGNEPGSMRSLQSFVWKGDSKQIRWFVRSRPRVWVFWGSLAILLLLLLFFVLVRTRFYSSWLEQRGSYAVEPAAWVGLACSLMGMMIVTGTLFVSPFTRRPVNYYEQGKLYYLVDTNSEIWFSAEKSRGAKSVPDLAVTLEDCINRQIVELPPASIKSFWEWFLGGDGYGEVKDPKDYALNPPFVLDVYSFSGYFDEALEKDDWQRLGSGAKGIVAKSLANGTLRTDLRRESRLLCPPAVLADEVRRSVDSRPGKDVPQCVLVLTSACAPCREDVDAFYQALRSVDTACRSEMSVFTVLVPSLPRSGSDAPYAFEETKAGFAASYSDRLVLLNRPAESDWDARIKQSLAQPLPHGVPVRRVSQGQCARIALRTPLYSIPALTSPHRLVWQRPCDLDAIRRASLGAQHSLLFPDKQLRPACSEIAREFAKMARVQDGEKRSRQIHVVGRDPLLPPLGLCILLLGLFTFHDQYNGAYLLRYDFPSMGAYHTAILAIVELTAVFFVLELLWRSGDPQRWTSCGDPRWAFLFALTCWLCWLGGPLIFLRQRTRGISGRVAFCSTVVSTVGLGMLVLWWGVPRILGHWAHGTTSSDTGEAAWPWFWIPAVLAWLPLAVLPLPVSGSSDSLGPVPGTHCDWWRTPHGSALIKTLMILCLLFLLRGAYPASPTPLVGYFTGFSGGLSHTNFVFLTGLVYSLLGVLISFTQDRQYARFRWLPVCAALFCIVPLFWDSFVRSTGG
jgi:hypothetical protein